MDGNGRPAYSEEQYHKWFDDLAPFFKLGLTLSSAIQDAGLQKHRTTLYEKVRLGDWFSDEMEALQAIPGKLANNILVKRVMQVDEKVKQGLPISDEEMKDVRFIAEKHRSSQPYFTNRQEISKADPFEIEKILDGLEEEKMRTNYDDFAEQARKSLERDNVHIPQA